MDESVIHSHGSARKQAPWCGHSSGSAPIAVEEVARCACRVRFESRDPAKNRARFSTVTWQPALWGGGAIVRRWGRLGRQGRALTIFSPDRASAQEVVERLLRRRLGRGYQVVAWW